MLGVGFGLCVYMCSCYACLSYNATIWHNSASTIHPRFLVFISYRMGGCPTVTNAHMQRQLHAACQGRTLEKEKSRYAAEVTRRRACDLVVHNAMFKPFHTNLFTIYMHDQWSALYMWCMTFESFLPRL